MLGSGTIFVSNIRAGRSDLLLLKRFVEVEKKTHMNVYNCAYLADESRGSHHDNIPYAIANDLKSARDFKAGHEAPIRKLTAEELDKIKSRRPKLQGYLDDLLRV